VSTRFHKNPLFFSPQELQQPTQPPIIYSYNSLDSKERKMSQSFSNNHNSFNTINNTICSNTIVAEDEHNILAWISPLDPKLRHQDIRDRRVGNVGEWVLETEEFRSWYAGAKGDGSEKPVLFCYGDPGVGKTHIR